MPDLKPEIKIENRRDQHKPAMIFAGIPKLPAKICRVDYAVDTLSFDECDHFHD